LKPGATRRSGLSAGLYLAKADGDDGVIRRLERALFDLVTQAVPVPKRSCVICPKIDDPRDTGRNKNIIFRD